MAGVRELKRLKGNGKAQGEAPAFAPSESDIESARRIALGISRGRGEPISLTTQLWVIQQGDPVATELVAAKTTHPTVQDTIIEKATELLGSGNRFVAEKLMDALVGNPDFHAASQVKIPVDLFKGAVRKLAGLPHVQPGMERIIYWSDDAKAKAALRGNRCSTANRFNIAEEEIEGAL